MRNKEQRIGGTNSLLVRTGILLAVLLVFILGAVYWYFTDFYVKTYRDNRFYFNQISMESVEKAMEDRAQEHSKQMAQLFETPAVNRFVVQGREYVDGDMLSSTLALKQWAEGDEGILDAHLLVLDSGIVLQSDRIVTTLDDYAEPERFEEFSADFTEMGKPVMQNGALRICIAFPQDRPLALLSVTLDTATLAAAADEATGGSAAWPIYLYDGRGQEIFAQEKTYPDFSSGELEPEAEGLGYSCYHLKQDPHTFVMKSYSDSTGWFTITTIQDTEMEPPGLQIFETVYPMLLLLLAVILLISFLLIFQIFPPLMRLRRTVDANLGRTPGQGGVGSRRGNELDYLRQAIEQNDREREQLKKLLDISSGEVVEKLFELTMNDSTDNSGEWFGMLRNMDHPFTHEGKYVLVLVRWQGSPESLNERSRSVHSLDVRMQIADFWGTKCSFQMFSAGEFCLGLILRYGEQTIASRIRRDLELFDTVMKNNIARNLNMAWGWGSVEDSLEQVAATRSEAEEELERFAQEAQKDSSTDSEESGRKEQYRYVERAQRYIQENYSDGMLSLDVVSEHLGISSPYLSGLMTRYLSMGFTEYLSRYRVEKARELLAGSNDSITEIGEKTGFSSIQNFGRVFKKYNGESAGQYRKRVREEQEAGTPVPLFQKEETEG